MFLLKAEFVDYLPKGQGKSKQFGGINVTVKQITEKADYVLTILSIVEGKVRHTKCFSDLMKVINI